MSASEPVFDRAFWQAVNDMREGAERPIEEYLELVPAAEREELAAMLADVQLARGPGEASGSAEAEGYSRALAVVDRVLGAKGSAGILPGVLQTIQSARGIDPEAVVERLANEFEIKGERGRRALARSYHRLESGKLLGSALSSRLVVQIAAILGIEEADIRSAARPRAAKASLRPVQAMGRGGASPPRGRSTAAAPAALDPEVELVDRLFSGGPHA